MKLDRRRFIATGAAVGLAAYRGARAEAGREETLSDPLGVRADFPAASRGTYLNTPYIGPVPESVARAGVDFARAKAESPIPLGDMLAETEKVRGKLASLFGAKESEIAFLSSTSEGENVVAGSLELGPGDNVVVDDLHYTTSYVLYKTLERERALEVRVVPSSGGRADAEHFAPYVDRRTRLVSIAWVSHQNGFRHDLAALASLAHAHGALLYADGIQGLGMLDVGLRDSGVDFLTSGTYKWLHASFGVAPFFVREEHLDRIAPDRLGWHQIAEEKPGFEFELHETARKYEYATLAFGPVYQLGAALDYLAAIGLARIEAHTVGLARELRQGLVDLGFAARTPAGNASAIVAFVHGKDPADVRRVVDEEGVQLSFRENDTQIRVGTAVFNTKQDVERFLGAAERVRDL